MKWYNNGLKEIQINDETEVPNGFIKGRLSRKKPIEQLAEKICKEELFQYYIIDNNNYPKTMEHFSISRRDLIQLLRYYKISKNLSLAKSKTMSGRKSNRTHESYLNGGKKSAETQKENWINKSEQEKLLWSQKCSDIQLNLSDDIKNAKKIKNFEYISSLTPEERQAQNKKRSDSCKKTWSNKDLIKKRNETAKKNREKNKCHLCKSEAEQKIYNSLIISYSDLIYDKVIDERYPFYCDFYIPSMDLFIEYNGHPSHGKVPYDINNPEAVEIAYKFHTHWLDVYTHRDVEKAITAKKNNLNYIRIYPSTSLQNNFIINDNKYIELITIIYNLVK